jgi:hypothetical protein
VNLLIVSDVGWSCFSGAMLPVPTFASKVTVSNVSVTVNEYVHVPKSPFESLSVPETV